MALNKWLKPGDIVYAGDVKIRVTPSKGLILEADSSTLIITATECKPGGYPNENTKNVKE